MTRVASDDTTAHVVRKRPVWTTWPGGRCTRSSLVLGVLVLAAVVSTRWVRLNLSPSVPVGLYWVFRLEMRQLIDSKRQHRKA